MKVLGLCTLWAIIVGMISGVLVGAHYLYHFGPNWMCRMDNGSPSIALVVISLMLIAFIFVSGTALTAQDGK